MNFYKDVGNRIKRYRNLKGITLEELGNKIGVGKSTVRKYQDGEIRIDHNRLSAIAEVLGIDVSLLYGEEVQFDLVNVPQYGDISCGDGLFNFGEVQENIPTPKEWINNDICFYLRAKGDSMVGAGINEGDLLLIRQQPEVNNGEIAAVLVDDKIHLKKVIKSGDNITLISNNPNRAFPPRIYRPDQEHVRIIGKLKKSITSY